MSFLSFLSFCLIRCFAVTGFWCSGISTFMPAAKPMVKKYMSLMDTLNFVQSVSSPTHNRGHTLDLVLTLGFSLHILCWNFWSLPCGVWTCYFIWPAHTFSARSLLCLSCNYCIFWEFSESYSKFLSNSNASLSSCMDIEQLFDIFNCLLYCSEYSSST